MMIRLTSPSAQKAVDGPFSTPKGSKRVCLRIRTQYGAALPAGAADWAGADAAGAGEPAPPPPPDGLVHAPSAAMMKSNARIDLRTT